MFEYQLKAIQAAHDALAEIRVISATVTQHAAMQALKKSFPFVATKIKPWVIIQSATAKDA